MPSDCHAPADLTAKTEQLQKIGLLSYHNNGNLGDEIQSIAIQRLAPHIDYFIDRDRLADFSHSEDHIVKLVCNGWFSHHPQNWPPAASIVPMLISMHFTQQSSVHGINPANFMLSPFLVDYLRTYGPVGARDLYTLRLLQEQNVEAYFSGCATLTLKPTGIKRREDLIVLNDVPLSVFDYVRNRTRRTIVSITSGGWHKDPAKRRAEAEDLLQLFESAYCVITSRLHAALPCLGVGTPVVLISSAPDAYRFEGLRDLFRHGSIDEFLSGRLCNLEHLENNRLDFIPFARNIEQAVRAFFKEDAVVSPFDALQANRLGLVAELSSLNSRLKDLLAENLRLGGIHRNE